MTKFGWAMGATVVSAALAAGTVAAQRASGPNKPTTGAVAAPVSSHAPAPPAPQTPRGAKSAQATSLALNFAIESFCVECHNDAEKKGSLTLEQFDIGRATDHLETVEKMIRKLQAGMMPPPGVERPDSETYSTLIATLETKADAAALAQAQSRHAHVPAAEPAGIPPTRFAICSRSTSMPARGCRTTRRALNFDNIADEQGLSATLLESYLNAAADISRMAVGDRNALGRLSHLHQHQLRVAASVGSRARRAVRHARRVGDQARVPGRRGVHVRAHPHRRRQLPARKHRRLDRRRARRARPLRDAARRARPTGAARSRCIPNRFRSRRASTSWPPRSCAGSTVRTKT